MRHPTADPFLSHLLAGLRAAIEERKRNGTYGKPMVSDRETLEISEAGLIALPARVQRLLQTYGSRWRRLGNGLHAVDLPGYRVAEVEQAMREELEKAGRLCGCGQAVPAREAEIVRRHLGVCVCGVCRERMRER